ncbi:hypothetical protein H1P_3670003 [Hyella patelloides LEGE 07179]|uniref:Uncharacterized protein n=1 Tax=Hyella patelloides LEGE 07179 TaxID=945734 RepID=A0A563VWI6_9CYAN|nr:hypothetical protein H1P_3670003 [Hyella patelloides LEGE 07179]
MQTPATKSVVATNTKIGRLDAMRIKKLDPSTTIIQGDGIKP